MPNDFKLSASGASYGLYDGSKFVEGHNRNRKDVCAQGMSACSWSVQQVLTVCGTGKRYKLVTTINLLPDNVLLDIFDFRQWMHDFGYLNFGWRPSVVWKWHILVHVCQRWRHIIFGSPLRLNLQIFCTYGTPVRKSLDIWPTFPIVIGYEGRDRRGRSHNLGPTDEDNIIAALEHPSRVCEVRLLAVTGSQSERIAAIMQEPFPALTHLLLSSKYRNVPVLPREFLGRSAPCLQELKLDGIPFPALPILLLSASDLVTLKLCNIPQTGYISPEVMAAALTTLTRLGFLDIEFRSPNARPGQMRPPPTTRTVLPALTYFSFHGVREYLEDFMARIDAPRLDSIKIYYLNQLVDFDVLQLSRFIEHSENLNHPMRCSIQFQSNHVSFCAGPTSYIPESFTVFPHYIDVTILCEGIDWQVSHLTRAFSQMSAILLNMVHFTIHSNLTRPQREDMDDIQWLQLLSPFASVQTLFVSREFAGHVSRALEDIAGTMATDPFPTLDRLCLEGLPVSSVDKFIAVHRDSGRHVTLVDTRRAFEERLKSYP